MFLQISDLTEQNGSNPNYYGWGVETGFSASVGGYTVEEVSSTLITLGIVAVTHKITLLGDYDTGATDFFPADFNWSDSKNTYSASVITSAGGWTRSLASGSTSWSKQTVYADLATAQSFHYGSGELYSAYIFIGASMADSTHYHCHIKGDEGTGTPVDSAGSETVGIGAAISNLWANSGWMSSVASSGASGSSGDFAQSGGFYVSQPDWNMDDGDSLLLMFWIKGASLSGSKFGGTSARSNNAGFFITASTNLLSLTLQDGTNQISMRSRTDVLDDTPHHVAIAIDGATKRGYLFVDGKPNKDPVETQSDDFSGISGTTINPSDDVLGFGIAGDGGGPEASYAAQWRDIHCLTWDQEGLPSHIRDIVNWAIQNPYQTLQNTTVEDFAQDKARAKSVLALVIGQSNEGQNFTGNARPVLERSVPSAGQYKFEIGIGHGFDTNSLLAFYNPDETAVTGVAVVDYDISSITTADTGLTNFDEDGTYIAVSNTQAASKNGAPNAGTKMWVELSTYLWNFQQIWAHTVDRFSIGGTSFITDWCGISAQGDAGTVLAGTHSGSNPAGFDPNDYLSDAYDDVENYVAAGFDELWIIIQHGQADASWSGSLYNGGELGGSQATTQAKQLEYYTAAVENIIDYFADLNPTRVYVGSSNQHGQGAGGSDDSAQFAAVIVPGMKAAASSKGARLGPMLSELLGSGYNHNFEDSHLNVNGQRQATEAWQVALAVASSSGSATPGTVDLNRLINADTLIQAG